MKYSIRASADKKTVSLDLYEDIGQGGLFFEAVSAKAVRRFLAANLNAERINLNVNSRGGDVVEGFAIYNALANHPARVVANVDSLAASMASVVIMAADEVNIASNGRIMVHNPSAGLRGESKDLRRVATLLDSMRDDIVDAYHTKTKIPKEELRAMMDSERWLSAKEAKRLGFVDSIVDTKKAKFTACLTAADLDDYDNVPEDVVAEVRNSAPESATMEDIDIEVEEEMTPEEIQAAINKGIADALAAHKAQEAAAKAQADAQAAATAQAEEAVKFKARVNDACERAISAGKLANSAESRKFFAEAAKDEATLKVLEAHYAVSAPIVATALSETPEVKAGKVQLTAEQKKICDAMGWDPEKIFADEDESK